MSKFKLGDLGNKEKLKRMAKQVADKADDLSQKAAEAVGKQAEKTLDDLTGSDQASTKIKAGYKAVSEKTETLVEKGKTAADKLAQSSAEKLSDVTGKDVSPEQVKKAAIVSAMVVAAVGSIESVAAEGLVESDMAAPEGGVDAPENASGTGSFEEETNKFFADKGGLNIQTNVVDGDGVILDSGE